MAALRTSFWANIFRKKTLQPESLQTGETPYLSLVCSLSLSCKHSDLKKCLTLSDLTFLAIGSMVGSGLYVLTGTVAHNVTGPSVILSYVIAAIASGLSAICYAEFGARIPITGSAYQFTYLSIGEFWAFIIGWNVLLEHAVAASAVAKSWSGYLDALFNKAVQIYLIKHCPMPGGILAKFPDFLAVAFLLICTIILISGAQMSSRVTAGFAGLNLIIVLIIIVTGFFLGDLKNWTSVKGGFFPFGFSGTISGAATLIFSYVGYEIVASTTEEALRPARDVPLSLLIALVVVVLAYTGASTSLTLMVPWNNISVLSPFPEAYAVHGWTWARYLVTVGAMAAMTTTLIASMFVVPRYLFAMARDGLLMGFFAVVNETTKVPVISVLVCSAACIVMAILFELHVLVEFISIGQLLACTFVAICVIKLRYQPNSITRYMEFHNSGKGFPDKVVTEVPEESDESITNANANYGTMSLSEIASPSEFDSPARSTSSTKSNDADEDDFMRCEHIVGTVKTEVLESKYRHFFLPLTKYEPGFVPFCLLLIATLCAIIVIAFALFTHEYISSWWCILFITLFSIISLASVLLLEIFHQDQTIKTFKVPLVPYLPFLSIIINVILILKLQPMTWVRLGVWVAIGIVVYLCYGYRHSVERKEE